MVYGATHGVDRRRLLQHLSHLKSVVARPSGSLQGILMLLEGSMRNGEVQAFLPMRKSLLNVFTRWRLRIYLSQDGSTLGLTSKMRKILCPRSLIEL